MESAAEEVAPEGDQSIPGPGPEPVEEFTAALPREAAIEDALPEFSAEDFDMPMAELESEPESVPVVDLSGIDLDLNTTEFPPTPEVPVEIADEIESSLDFEPPSLTDAGVLATELVAPAPEPVEAVSAETSMDPELREEVNTKLDLARAYLEMGDREGAREILQEVLNEGDAGQKAEAGKLMSEAG
jgi:pilus assembly protein FimV